MAGVLEGLDVLDLSWGISGPVATMLLADHGADVIRIEPPGGAPLEGFSGSRVWARGKRSAVLDLTDDADRETFIALASAADVVVESFAPGVAERLGVDYETLRRRNGRLIYCSISGYGESGEHADRPGYDSLVAARTGQHWEHRGVVGGTIERVSGGLGLLPGIEPEDPDCWVGPDREGPLFGGVPWPSMAAAYLANLAITAAVRERELSGHGQRVSTSLLQGALATTVGTWQRVERFDHPGFQSWIGDPRAPKGFYQTSDGRWTHHWVPLPSFILGVSAGDEIGVAPGGGGDWQVSSPKDAPLRIGVAADEMVILHAFHGQMRDAVAKFPASDWTRIATDVGVPVQMVRSPEEALLDPSFVEDGCVLELDDPEVGRIRQVGSVYRLSECPTDPPRPRALTGEHTEQVRQEAREATAVGPVDEPRTRRDAPLAGVRVLDLGLAVAGPFGTQLLSDLGADVIKINTLTDAYWFGTHIGMCCNHGKRSISMNLKDPEVLAALHRLVESADIVQHNMRYDAAERLGVDYESLRKINPNLIYCHTRGFEHGWRDGLPGNDQTGAALAGTEWLDGAVENGGEPIWSANSLGDTGNGFLSAIGMIQALYHRDRTGRGQFVDTSIVYAQLLNSSMSWISPDGETASGRPSLDAMNFGWHPLYRLYETSDGWLSIAALGGAQWAALCETIGRSDLLGDERFVSGEDRTSNAESLGVELESTFRQRAAADWFEALDTAGVPCEVSNRDFVMELFDDEEFREKGWVTTVQHGVVGKMDIAGLLLDLDDTPGRIQGPSPVVGAHSREILREVGLTDDQVDTLVDRGVILADTGPPTGTGRERGDDVSSDIVATAR